MDLEKKNGDERYNLNVTLEKAVVDLSRKDPREVSLNSGVTYNRENGSYLLSYLNRQYYVHHESGEVKPLEGEQSISIQQRILFLHYLACADGTPLKNEWITFKELPGGQIYVEPYQKRTIKPLLKIFGHQPEKFAEMAPAYGGIRISLTGDLAVHFRPFPRVPMVFVLWEGDEELSPSATILYDVSAANYLPTEDYALLPGMIIFDMAAKLKR